MAHSDKLEALAKRKADKRRTRALRQARKIKRLLRS